MPARSERGPYLELMEQERLRQDYAEFARSVRCLQATSAETSRLSNEILILTRIGMEAIQFARARVVGRAGRRRLRMTGT